MDIKKTNYINTKIENIRVIKGTNFDYFLKRVKKYFMRRNSQYRNFQTEQA